MLTLRPAWLYAARQPTQRHSSTPLVQVYARSLNVYVCAFLCFATKIRISNSRLPALKNARAFKLKAIPGVQGAACVGCSNNAFC